MQPDNTYLTTFTLPSGATTGLRIVLDGVAGTITGYYADNRIAFQMSTNPAAAIVDFSDDALPELAGFYNGQAVFAQDTSPTIATNKAVMGWDRSVEEFFVEMYNGAGNHTRMALLNFVGGSAGISNLAWAQAAPVSVWNNLNFISPFVVGSNASTAYFGLQWKVDAEDNIIIAGACHATAILPVGNSTIGTIPVTPANVWNGTDVKRLSSADALYPPESMRLTLNKGGNFSITLGTASVANDNFYIYFCRPLGQIL